MAGIRKDCFKQLEKVKEFINKEIPQMQGRDLCKILSKLGTFHYNKKKGFLIGLERELYELLIENSYNPYTVYKWCLLERVPDEIKFQLNNHYISQKKASRLFFERRHETETSLQLNVKELGLKLIRGM